METIKGEKVTWINMKDPSGDDIIYLQNNFKLHPLVIEEFSEPTMRPKAAQYGDCLYLAIHIPLFDVDKKTTYAAELDIAMTGDYLITAHTNSILQLEEFFKELKSDDALRQRYLMYSPAFLLHHILEMLLESCFPKLDHIARKLERIEDEIFSGNEKGMVFEISYIKRDILNFRRTLKPQRSVIESLAQRDSSLIPQEMRPYFQDLIGTNIRVWNTLENTKEVAESMEDTNNSLLSNKLNSTMKVLTIFSAVMLPMTVYSNILAMSADIPFGKNPFGFWIHITIMIFISLFTIAMFKARKWF